jgi:hypothetical protein
MCTKDRKAGPLDVVSTPGITPEWGDVDHRRDMNKNADFLLKKLWTSEEVCTIVHV